MSDAPHTAFASADQAELLHNGFALLAPYVARGLEDPSPAAPGELGVAGAIVGNHRSLWTALRQHYAQRPLPPDPIDHYCETTLLPWAKRSGVSRIHWGHRAPFPPLQQIAAAAGLAALGPAHLSAHFVFGPWLALRAVFLWNQPAVGGDTVTVHPCGNCSAPCTEALAAALRLVPVDRFHAARDSEEWRHWLAIRDACPVGREWRYAEAELVYHYTHRIDEVGPSPFSSPAEQD